MRLSGRNDRPLGKDENGNRARRIARGASRLAGKFRTFSPPRKTSKSKSFTSALFPGRIGTGAGASVQAKVTRSSPRVDTATQSVCVSPVAIGTSSLTNIRSREGLVLCGAPPLRLPAFVATPGVPAFAFVVLLFPKSGNDRPTHARPKPWRTLGGGSRGKPVSLKPGVAHDGVGRLDERGGGFEPKRGVGLFFVTASSLRSTCKVFSASKPFSPPPPNVPPLFEVLPHKQRRAGDDRGGHAGARDFRDAARVRLWSRRRIDSVDSVDSRGVPVVRGKRPRGKRIKRTVVRAKRGARRRGHDFAGRDEIWFNPAIRCGAEARETGDDVDSFF